MEQLTIEQLRMLQDAMGLYRREYGNTISEDLKLQNSVVRWILDRTNELFDYEPKPKKSFWQVIWGQ